MTVREAKELFRQMVAKYFAGATVIYGRQSRIAKPALPLVCLTAGDVRRTANPAITYVEGQEVMFYPSRIVFTVDLFTHGAPIQVGGKTVAYADTALEDIQSFSNFMDSIYARDWCVANDITVLIDGDARDMTDLINDTNYQYRAQLTVNVYFTQYSIGRAGVLDEDSLQFAVPGTGGGSGGEGGEGGEGGSGDTEYTPNEPKDTESSTNGPGRRDDINDGSIKVIPTYHPTISGGGSKELAEKMTGYFTSAEVTEVKEGSEADEQKL